jgi:hypothetical protein
MQGCRHFNKSSIFKNIPNPKGIIQISHVRHLDKIQLNFNSRHFMLLFNHVKALSNSYKAIKVNHKLIHDFKYNNSQVQIVQWSNTGFRSTIIIQDPDLDIQIQLLDVFSICEVKLSQVEIALDIFPKHQGDIDNLEEILLNGLVLRHSRGKSHNKYLTTNYFGKDGNVRSGSKGLRIYQKNIGKTCFIRVEIQFNRGFIRRKLRLPINADDINLTDFLTYRQNLEVKRLAKTLSRKYQKGRNCEKYPDLPDLLERHLESYILAKITHDPFQELILADHMAAFKAHFRNDNLGHRINEFFPRNARKLRLFEDMERGFIRRKY